MLGYLDSFLSLVGGRGNKNCEYQESQCDIPTNFTSKHFAFAQVVIFGAFNHTTTRWWETTHVRVFSRPRLLFATFSWKLGFLRHWNPRAWGMGGERMVVSWDAKLGCFGTWRKDGSLSTENALSLCLEPGIFGAELGSGANRLRHLTMKIHSSPRVAKSEGHDIAWEFGSCFGVITVTIHKGKAWCQDWTLLYLAAALVSCIHAFSFALSQHTPRPTGEIEWEIGSSFQHLSNKAIWWGVQLFLGVASVSPSRLLAWSPGSRRSQSRSMGGRIHCRWFTKQFACHDHRTTWLPKKERTDLFRGYDFA